VPFSTSTVKDGLATTSVKTGINSGEVVSQVGGAIGSTQSGLSEVSVKVAAGSNAASKHGSIGLHSTLKDASKDALPMRAGSTGGAAVKDDTTTGGGGRQSASKGVAIGCKENISASDKKLATFVKVVVVFIKLCFIFNYK